MNKIRRHTKKARKKDQREKYQQNLTWNSLRQGFYGNYDFHKRVGGSERILKLLNYERDKNDKNKKHSIRDEEILKQVNHWVIHSRGKN